MSNYYSFSEEAIQNALDAAKKAHESGSLKGASEFSAGHLNVSAECISVVVGDHKVCLDLPLGIGKVCIPIPVSFPSGTAAQACLKICTFMGIPSGVEVYVSIAGVQVAHQSWGKC